MNDAMLDQTFDRVLLALHAAAAAKPAWQGFLQALHDELDLSYANLIFRRGPSRAVDAEFSAGHSMTDDLRQVYRDQFALLDPVRYFAMAPGRSYRLHELLAVPAAATGLDHRYYRDFLEPAGLARMISARVVEPGGEMAWLTISRTARQDDFTAAEQRLFDRLLPHAAVALQTFVLVERQRVRGAIGRHVSSSFDMASITLTATGQVIGTGPVASSILAAGDALRVAGDGRLHPADAGMRRRLDEAMAEVVATRQSRALLLEAEAGRIEVLLTPFRASGVRASVRPDLVLFVRRHRRPGASDRVRQSLTAMFGLTPTEADIALGLADGRTMNEVAADLGLSAQTVRSYSRSIYPKLGVRRQVDLVRLLLLSVAQLA